MRGRARAAAGFPGGGSVGRTRSCSEWRGRHESAVSWGSAPVILISTTPKPPEIDSLNKYCMVAVPSPPQDKTSGLSLQSVCRFLGPACVEFVELRLCAFFRRVHARLSHSPPLWSTPFLPAQHHQAAKHSSLCQCSRGKEDSQDDSSVADRFTFVLLTPL